MVYPYIRFNLEGGRIIYLQLIRVLPRLTRIVRLLEFVVSVHVTCMIMITDDSDWDSAHSARVAAVL